MKKLIFTMTVAACFAAAQAQTNENRGSINLWGYVVDSFLQTGLEGAKVTLMTADSTVVDSIRTYPYDGNALFHFSLPAKTQNIILRAEQEGYETGYVSMKVRYYKREKEVYAPWINLKKPHRPRHSQPHEQPSMEHFKHWLFQHKLQFTAAIFHAHCGI